MDSRERKIESLNDLYEFAEDYATSLSQEGHGELSREIDRALRGGATSGEILTYLSLALTKAETAGLGNDRVAAALRYIKHL